jgi:hypothetical protein
MIAIPNAYYSGCSKRFFNKAAGEKAPEAYLRRYVEEGFEPRTTLRSFFSTLLCR